MFETYQLKIGRTMFLTYWPKLHLLIRKVASFFLGSSAGLIVDLTVFQSLTFLGVTPFWANICSSTMAITTTYFAVIRYTFKVNSSWFSFIGFVSWYACSIVFFSAVIHYVILLTGWLPLICKLSTLPFSFSANFIFGYFFLGRKKNV